MSVLHKRKNKAQRLKTSGSLTQKNPPGAPTPRRSRSSTNIINVAAAPRIIKAEHGSSAIEVAKSKNRALPPRYQNPPPEPEGAEGLQDVAPQHLRNSLPGRNVFNTDGSFSRFDWDASKRCESATGMQLLGEILADFELHADLRTVSGRMSGSEPDSDVKFPPQRQCAELCLAYPKTGGKLYL